MESAPNSENSQAPSEQPVNPAVSRPPVASLRTFRTDVQTQIQEKGLSAVEIAQKEAEKRRSTLKVPPPSPSRRSYLPLIGGVSLVLLLISLGAWGYVSSRNENNTPLANDGVTRAPEALIFAENRVIIDANAVSSSESLQKLIQTELAKLRSDTGAITELLFTVSNGPNSLFVDATSFTKAAFSSLSDELARALEPQFMFGTYAAGKPSAFLVVTSSSYERLRAGMLQWEAGICGDFEKTVGKTDCVDNGTVPWTDAVIRNTDVREKRDSNGHIILAYGFLNKNTVIVVQNQATFTELLTRYHTPRPVVR